MKLDISKVTQSEFKTLKKEVLLLPLGAVEAHYNHLPLGTDTIIAQSLAEEVSRRTGWPSLPAFQFGYIYGLRNFDGSISVSDELLRSFIAEMVNEAGKNNFKVLAVINCHIPNAPIINEALLRVSGKSKAKGVNLTFPGYNEAYYKFCESKMWTIGIFHADELETSLMLYLRPELVDLGKAVRNYPAAPKTFGYIPLSWAEFTSISVAGDPTLATKKKGRLIFEFFVKRIIEITNEALINEK
ncbi:MAG: creatininase family protein [Candidatus Bathyarchaeia archaeon]